MSLWKELSVQDHAEDVNATSVTFLLTDIETKLGSIVKLNRKTEISKDFWPWGGIVAVTAIQEPGTI